MPISQAIESRKKPKAPPRTVWTGFRDGKQTIETSMHVDSVLADAAQYVGQLAACGDEKAKEIAGTLGSLAGWYAEVRRRQEVAGS